MAWPVDARSVVFQNGTVVSPDFLNDVQDKIVGVYGGTLSLKAMVVDGTGAAVTAPTAGTMTASGNISAPTMTPTTAISGTVAPTTATTLNKLYKELVPIAAGHVTAAGALYWGVNINSVTRTGSGAFYVTLVTAATGVNTYFVLAQVHNYANAGGSVGIIPANTSASRIDFALQLTNTGATLDSDFGFIVYGY